MRGKFSSIAIHTPLLPPMMLALAAFAHTFGAPAVAQAKDVDPGKRLAELRSAVDELETKLEDVRAQARSERLSLETQRGDLEVMLRTETVRRETLLRLGAKLQSDQRHAAADSEAMRGPGLAAAQLVRDSIAASLPFQRDARLSAADQSIAEFQRPDTDPLLAISRLWQLCEDEIRLTEEVGLYKQVVEVGGERHLAEVARLGMAVLYFRLSDGRMGWAVLGDAGFTFEFLQQARQTRAVADLYDALRKQLRQGVFDLPLPKPSST